ncbi:MucB/RseB C-terminal domain-containing protein [Rhodoferax sp.]|uniref:MucB/RseB C-terminal domain-containing protein n=1 Tax=Rhodoferax sp. TaxID=50421 RepID=UPI00283B76DD|nr:MucB/RseB C-terminal domain-containing protein [Rhodoferax sp.]MDR3370551.1 MucB/RseB C-terminal domain-containing protein [Rhodoferax sp.]
MSLWVGVLAWLLGSFSHIGALAQPVGLQVANATVAATGIDRWLMRLHEAPRSCAYVGTFVVTVGSDMSSSRIWHVGNGQRQMERVEALTGTPRTTFRLNDEVVTFLQDSRTIVHEKREALDLFPNLLNRADASVKRLYRLRMLGQGRVAGLEADIAQLLPIDKLRYGYQIWTDQKTGMMIKLQTLDASGNVLEQAAFSELELDAPVTMSKLKSMMDDTKGYRVVRPHLVQTTADQEGWFLSTTVPGFAPVRCYKRLEGDGPTAEEILQCVFTDGLASVSLFVEPFDASRHARMLTHNQMSIGATSLHVRHLAKWWLTAVGEVPPQTLVTFVQAFERKH